MKKSLLFRLFAVVLVAFTLSCICFAAERITVPNFKVKINGKVVSSTYRDYPMIVYNGITYFPMTYNDCRFLGLSTDWNSGTNTLTISKEYDANASYIGNSLSRKNPSQDYATVSNYNIVVNGKRIDNRYEQYPILNYRNVTYFPLTWRFAVEEFGWSYNFDPQSGLTISSDGSASVTAAEHTAYINGKQQELRPWYNMGSCTTLNDKVYYLLMFVSDNESGWTKQETDDITFKLYGAVDYLKSECGEFGVSFDASYGQYGVDGNEIKYNGVISGELGKTDGNSLVNQTMSSLGFTSLGNMFEFIREFSGCEQVIPVFVIDKPGASYAMPDMVSGDGFESLEYLVIFSQFPGGEELVEATLAHETLHLFGALDLYDPYNDLPNRDLLSQKYYKHDIMLVVYTDISYNVIDEYTAYSVGLTDIPPELCKTSDWWS